MLLISVQVHVSLSFSLAVYVTAHNKIGADYGWLSTNVLHRNTSQILCSTNSTQLVIIDFRPLNSLHLSIWQEDSYSLALVSIGALLLLLFSNFSSGAQCTTGMLQAYSCCSEITAQKIIREWPQVKNYSIPHPGLQATPILFARSRKCLTS
jgi:hypothetical protein